MVPKVISGLKRAACMDSTAALNSAGQESLLPLASPAAPAPLAWLEEVVSGFITGLNVTSNSLRWGRRAVSEPARSVECYTTFV